MTTVLVCSVTNYGSHSYVTLDNTLSMPESL